MIKKMWHKEINYNLLCCEDFTNIEDKYKKIYCLTGEPNDSESEIYMKNVYDMIVQFKLKKPLGYKYKKLELIGVEFPKYFVSEVLNFGSKEKYLNQLKLNQIVGIIDKRIVYEGERKNSEYPITGKLVDFFSKKKKLIYASLIQESIFFALNGLYLDLDVFIQDMRNIYNNPLDKTNYSFPILNSDIEDFEKLTNNIEEDGEKYIEKIKGITLEFIYKVIKPLTDINIDYIYELELDSTYELYYKKYGMPLCKFNGFFLDELYEKITKQSRMMLLTDCEYAESYPETVLYFSEFSQKLKFAWLEENIKYKPKRANIEFIEQFRNKKKDNTQSSKYIGDKYEMFCKKWLEQQGYTEVKIIGGRGDKGLDILAINFQSKIVGIQCKYKKSGTINSQDIRLLNGSKEYYENVEELMIFSNCPLSRDAVVDMAKFKIVGITLIGNDLFNSKMCFKV